jgi:hypothetical protein
MRQSRSRVPRGRRHRHPRLRRPRSLLPRHAAHPRPRSRLHLLHPRSHPCPRPRRRRCSLLCRRGPPRSSIPRGSASRPGGDCGRRRVVRTSEVHRVGREDETHLGLRPAGVPELLAQDARCSRRSPTPRSFVSSSIPCASARRRYPAHRRVLPRGSRPSSGSTRRRSLRSPSSPARRAIVRYGRPPAGRGLGCGPRRELSAAS